MAGIAYEKFEQATTALGEVKGDAEKALASAREGMGISDKDSKKG